MTNSNEEAYADLLDLEATLEALAETPGWQELERRARKTLDMQRLRLLSGEVDPAEYVKLAWQLRGSEWVLTGILSDVRASITEYRRQTAETERGKEQA